MISSFEMEDNIYMVNLVSYQRTCVPALTDHTMIAADGTCHYEDMGMQEQIEIVFRARPGLERELNLLWQDLSRGGVHLCHIPQDDGLEWVHAYMVECRQPLLSTQGMIRWGELRVVLRIVALMEDC